MGAGYVVPAHAGVLRTTSASCTVYVTPLSPRTRGCSDKEGSVIEWRAVVPAHAGVLRRRARTGRRASCCPRARGGAPRRPTARVRCGGLSPRTRGCSERRIAHVRTDRVVPAHAGVLRVGTCRVFRDPCCPRARGGAPTWEEAYWELRRLSPRTRGCSGAVDALRTCRVVVPAHAGVLRHGDRAAGAKVPLSPRTRGCSVRLASVRRAHDRCPRARGGAPPRCVSIEGIADVVPAHAGVLELGGRGEVRRPLSPRTRGCSV